MAYVIGMAKPFHIVRAENCPVFPGKARRIDWSSEDPGAVQGTPEEQLDAFRRSRDLLSARFSSFAAAPLASIGADRIT